MQNGPRPRARARAGAGHVYSVQRAVSLARVAYWGRYGPLWVAMCRYRRPCGPLWAAVGRCGPLWAAMGAAVDRYGQLGVQSGPRPRARARGRESVPGPTSSLLGPPGPLGPLWGALDRCGPLWAVGPAGTGAPERSEADPTYYTQFAEGILRKRSVSREVTAFGRRSVSTSSPLSQ
mgnify:CR=1 FL=1